MIYRPLVERTEWSGCAARNPDHHAYAELFAAIRNQFFVVSIADLQDVAEWILGNRVNADIQLHRGELGRAPNAPLTQTPGLMISSPGFVVILALSVGKNGSAARRERGCR